MRKLRCANPFDGNRSCRVTGYPLGRSPLLMPGSSAAVTECQALCQHAPHRRSCNSVMIAHYNGTAACDRDLLRSSFRGISAAFRTQAPPVDSIRWGIDFCSRPLAGRPGCGILSLLPEQGSPSPSAHRERVAVPLGRSVALGGLPKFVRVPEVCLGPAERAIDLGSSDRLAQGNLKDGARGPGPSLNDGHLHDADRFAVWFIARQKPTRTHSSSTRRHRAALLEHA